jgi:hypothetical protein
MAVNALTNSRHPSDALIAFTGACDDLPSLVPFVEVRLNWLCYCLSLLFSGERVFDPEAAVSSSNLTFFRKWQRSTSEKVLPSHSLEITPAL